MPVATLTRQAGQVNCCCCSRLSWDHNAKAVKSWHLLNWRCNPIATSPHTTLGKAQGCKLYPTLPQPTTATIHFLLRLVATCLRSLGLCFQPASSAAAPLAPAPPGSAAACMPDFHASRGEHHGLHHCSQQCALVQLMRAPTPAMHVTSGYAAPCPPASKSPGILTMPTPLTTTPTCLHQHLVPDLTCVASLLGWAGAPQLPHVPTCTQRTHP